MFLKDIENAAPSAEAGRFGRVIQHCRDNAVPVPQIYHLFAARPAAAKAMGDYMHEVMRGPSELSAGQRELIAAMTSAWNHCRF